MPCLPYTTQMNEIYVCSYLVLNTALGKRNEMEKMGGQLLKPTNSNVIINHFTVLTLYIFNTQQQPPMWLNTIMRGVLHIWIYKMEAKTTAVAKFYCGDCIAYMGILSGKIYM